MPPLFQQEVKMSSLGDYVHYHWSRYKEYGISEKDSGQAISDTSSIFIAHRAKVKNMIDNLQDFEIQEIQQKFNELSEQSYKALVECIQDPNRGKDTLKSLLKLVNKSWEDIDINRIIKDIKIKENQQTLIYQPTKNKSAIKSEQKIGIKKLNSNQAHYYKTLLSTLDKIKSKITELELTENTHFQMQINKIELALNSWVQGQNILTFNPESKAKAYLLPPKHTSIKLINALITELQGVASVNNILQAQLAEIIGTLAVNGIASNVDQALKRMISGELKMEGRGTTNASGISVSITSNLDQKWLESNYENSIYSSQIVQLEDNSINGKIQYGFKNITEEVQQKADIIWEGVANISMKNTAFDDDYIPDDYIPSISLQNSSLRLYLEGIEASQEGLGTHYLNVLASHRQDKNIPDLQKASAEARETLLLYMLYSAMTGEGQNRIGKMANVLAIYDKKKKDGALQVKLFSMKQILQKIAPSIMDYDGIISIPALTSFNLENKFVIEDNNQNIEAARTRITQLLAEASIKRISMKLPKSFLKDLEIK